MALDFHSPPMRPLLILLALTNLIVAVSAAQAQSKPNILVIYTDDLGYGDIQSYNPESKIPTPFIDELAASGIRFTDGHSAATSCTPSRYSILTGRMQFRQGRGGIFKSPGGPSLLEDERLTLPEMLRDNGYATAAVGKWHLGLEYPDKDGNVITTNMIDGVKMIDYTRPFGDGPIDHGFDYFYGSPCCPTTDTLYVYLENDRFTEAATRLHTRHDLKLPKNQPFQGHRTGMIGENFNFEETDQIFMKKSIQWMENHVAQNPEKPFFLYHSMQAPHLPALPSKPFQGKTGMSPLGDFIYEMDWIVGELMKTLDRLGIADNTLIFFGSDNGPERGPVIVMDKDYGHDSAGGYRGAKRDQHEAGHRTPFIIAWPGKIAPKQVSDQKISQTDLMATFASIIDAELPDDAAEDSFDMTPVLFGKQGDKQLRPYMLQQAFRGELSVRKGDWKYIDHKGTGGNKYDPKREERLFFVDSDPDAPGQLYNLADDPGENTNLYSQYPELVKELKGKIEEFKASGRSAPLRN